MGWDKWDWDWDLGGMGYGILPIPLIWAASIVVGDVVGKYKSKKNVSYLQKKRIFTFFHFVFSQ